MYNQNPSVRVRRQMKQDNVIKKLKLTNKEIKDKLSQLIVNQPLQLAECEILNNANTVSNDINSFINKN